MPYIPRPVPTAKSRRRGVALITSIILLVMVVLLLMTYLRILRSKTIPAPNGAVGTVLDAVTKDALGQIGADMPVRGVDQEPYDFPWICTKNADGTPTRRAVKLNYPDITGTYLTVPSWNTSAVVGQPIVTPGDPAQDDDWLAGSFPEGGSWPHLTNLRGTFLDARDNSGKPTHDLTQVRINPATGQRVPSDKIAGTDHVNVPLTDARLVDADGDGVGDSLWFYPDNSIVGNLRCVAAVYIEDLSAKINLNTATRVALSDPKDPTGRSPADVNLNALTAVFGAAPGELDAMVSWRNLGTPLGAASGDRECYNELRGARVTSDGSNGGVAAKRQDGAAEQQRFAGADQLALSFRGGLRDTDLGKINALGAQRVEASGSGLPTLLGAGSVMPNYRSGGYAGALDFLQRNPRRWVTAYSGEAANSTGANMSQNWYRLNPNIRNDDSFYHITSDWCMNHFYDGPDQWAGSNAGGGPAPSPYIAPGTADAYAIPVPYQKLIPDPSLRNDQFWRAAQGAVRDAKDKDNILSSEWDWNGWEPLPVLTEVYVQRFYARKASDGAIVVNADGTKTIPCNAYGGAASDKMSYAFEIANPYHIPCKLTNLSWTVRGPYRKSDGSAATEQIGLQSLAAALPGGWADKDADGDQILLPGHKIILWRKGNTGTSGKTDPNVDISGGLSATAASDPTVHLVDSPVDLTLGTSTADFFMVQLWGKKQNAKDANNVIQGDQMYTYLTLPWPRGVTMLERTSATSSATASGMTSATADGTEIGIMQADVKGCGVNQKLNCLQCRPARQGHQTIDRLTGAIATAQATDAGDTVVAYNMATNNYDSAMLSTLGKGDKVAWPPARTPARVDLANEKLWFSANGGKYGATGTQGRLDSLGDWLRIPVISIRDQANGNYRTVSPMAGGSAPGSGLPDDPTLQTYELTAKNDDGTSYCDADIAHWLYYLLDGGTQPLSSLCLDIKPGSDAWMYPAWNATQTYNAGNSGDFDAVAYGTGYYTAQAVGGGNTVAAGTMPADVNGGLGQPWIRQIQGNRLDWDSSKAYAVGDEVRCNGNFYRAVHAAAAGSDPTDQVSGVFTYLNVNNTDTGLPWVQVPHHDHPDFQVPRSWLLSHECDINIPNCSGGYDYLKNGTLAWFDHNGDGNGLDANPANNTKDWNNKECGWWNEYVVPGRINLNTMPGFLLREALPIASQTLRYQVADLIVARRNGAPKPGARAASVSGNGDGLSGRGLVSVFEPLDDAANLPVLAPASRYDTLEACKCLPQVASCRSDFFAVHILVQAYRSDDFSPGPVESHRRLVIVCRTNITQSGPSSPVVIAQYDY